MSVDHVMACSGYDTNTLLNNQKCWRYRILYDYWGFMAQLNSTKPKYPAKSYRNYLYFINDAAAEYYTNFSPGGAPSWNGKPPSPLGEGACSVMWGNAMIIFGGLKSNTTTQMYDFSAKTWKILAPMALAHFFFGCVLMPTRDKVLVVSTIPGGDERRSDIYDIGTNTWSITGSTVNARAGTSLVAL